MPLEQAQANQEYSSLAEIMETTEVTTRTGIRGANHRFPKQRVF